MREYGSELKGKSLLSLAFASLNSLGSSSTAKLNYLVTPKNACSTIKASLLGVDGNPHELFETVFIKGSVDFSKPTFCVTRNPYDRAISGYINKIARQNSKHILNKFAERYNTFLDPNITLREFFELLLRDENPHTLDEHFRPQFFTHNHDFIRPAFIGRIERMDEVQAFLESHGIRLRTFAPHATGASSRRGALSQIEADLIKQIYRSDFETYGYDKNHLNFESPPSIEQVQSVAVEFEVAATLREVNADRLLTHGHKLFNNMREIEAKIFYASSVILSNGALTSSTDLLLKHFVRDSTHEAMSGPGMVEDFLNSLSVMERLAYHAGRFHLYTQKVDAIFRFARRQKILYLKCRIKMILFLRSK